MNYLSDILAVRNKMSPSAIGCFFSNSLFAWLMRTKLKNFLDKKIINLEDKDFTEVDIIRGIEQRD